MDKSRGLDCVVELPNADPDALVLAFRGLQQPLFTAGEIDKLSSPDKGARQAVVEPPTPIQREIEWVVPPLPTATRYATESSLSSSSDMPSLTSLPNFARDHSEFLTAAVLERLLRSVGRSPFLNFSNNSYQDVRILAAACGLLLPLPRAAAAEDRYGTLPYGLLVTLWNSSVTQIAGLSAAGGLKVHPAMVNRWQQTLRNYDTTRYRQNGIRAVDEQQPALFCHIRHLSFSYKTGESYPNP